jgi:hypothetical protein
MKTANTSASAVTEVNGWTGGAGLLCSAHPTLGGIIDRAIVSGEWFVIFNNSAEITDGFATRADAIAAFDAALAA